MLMLIRACFSGVVRKSRENINSRGYPFQLAVTLIQFQCPDTDLGVASRSKVDR